MTDEEKLEVFKEYLDKIEKDTIKRFTEYCIINFPDYFWGLMASTHGTHHGKDETLIQHILNCLWISNKVISQFSKLWTQDQNDRLISAIILHDSFRCNNVDGSINIFTKEYVNEHNLSQELIGKYKTSREHPEAGYKELLKLSMRFNCDCVKNKQNVIGAKDLTPVLNAVREHYGPWGINKDRLFSLDWPFSNLSIQVHEIDYMATITTEYWTRK